VGLRLRQAVLAATELDPVTDALRTALELGEPFADPGVAHFGLRNAVFALGDTFLEVVSPVAEGTAAGRWLERQGGDCGYMLMFQVDDLDGARERARVIGVREVFEVELDDISEAHLHPADMRGAIVSISSPRPPGAWRWGGPDWGARRAQGRLAGGIVTVADAATVRDRWGSVLGVDPRAAGVEIRDGGERGLTTIRVGGREGEPVEIGGVWFEFTNDEAEEDG
jgi:hypothetical protein